MGKQSWKPGNMLNPVPAVMVSVADEEHRDADLTKPLFHVDPPNR